MAQVTRRRKQLLEGFEPEKNYPFAEAIALVQKNAVAKFPESFDIAVNLGVDPRQSDQAVRSATILPHGTGKTVRVAVFAGQDEHVKAAKEAGADIVGMEDLADSVKKGQLDFDVVIASPDAMRLVGQLGQILGPRGLMPNPKVGTVTADIGKAVSQAKAGQVRYRTDKKGIIHCRVGGAGFTVEQLQENISALLTDLKKAKPSSAKGVYFLKVTVSSTMGLGVLIDRATLPV